MINTLLDDRYLITDELGRGGMGIVYRARDQVLQRDVAVKVMSSSELGTEGQARMLQEARAAAGLNHPNVVAVHDVGQAPFGERSETSSYIVMELVEGELLRTYKPASLEEVVGIGSQICAALDEAHRNNIIHRDLKPENVILTHSQVIKLMDFGLARSTGATRITQEGTIVGTLSYLAPEVILGKPATASSDLYALGVMLYELAADRPPFQGDTLTAVISQHLHAPVVPPSVFDPLIPPDLDTLVVKLLSKQPDDRPKTVAEVGQELVSIRESLLTAEPTEAAESTTLNRLVRGRLVGRDGELAQATGLWQQAAAGNSQVLLISGEPGIGKTRLVRELIAYAEIAGGTVLSAECYSEGAVPYMPVAQVVRTALGNGFHHPLPEAVMADLLTLAPDLRLSFPDTPAPLPLDPKSEQSRLFESVVSLCQAMTADSALLLFLDDLHWADSGTLSLLRHLARRMRHQPMMMVATYREIDIDESRPFREMMLDLRREQLATRIKLSRLSQEQTKALLATLFSEEITPDFLEGIYQETEGNPFFIEEVCKALVESGELYFEDGRWHRPSMADLDIPQGVRDVIQSRVSKLPQEAQETLRLAAILGREFDFNTLVEASDLDNRAARAIEQLRPEDYEVLAHHYSEAGDEGHALKYYQLAGDRATAVFANKEAEAHYLSALDIVGNDEQRLALLISLGIGLSDQSRPEEAITAWRTAIELAQLMGRMNDVADLYGRSARAAWDGGDTPRGLAIGKQGLAVVEGTPDSGGYAHLLHETARAYLFNGILDEVEQLCLQSLNMAKEVGALNVQVQALTTLSLLPSYPVDQSISMLREAISLAESAGLIRDAERARYNLGTYCFWGAGDFPEAIEQMSLASKSARTRGDQAAELFYSVAGMVAEALQGNFSSARDLLAKGFELMEMAAEPGTGALGLMWAESVVQYADGDTAHAIMLLEDMVDKARTIGDLQMQQIGLNDLGEIFVTEDRFEEAVPVVNALLELEGKGLVVGDVKGHCLMSLVSINKGDVEVAYAQIKEAARKTEAKGYRFSERIWVPWTQAHLSVAERKWPDAWTAFEEAVEVVTSYKANWYRAKWQLEWAEAHLQRGEMKDRDRARELLQDARAEFEAMGVSVHVEQATKLLENLA